MAANDRTADGRRTVAGIDAGAAVEAACLVVILAVAAYLRFRGLGGASLWRDEAMSWLQAQGSFASVIAATASDNYPPLYNLSIAASMHLFGDSEWALRLPAAIFGVLNVLALYWVGRQSNGRRVGLLAALLLALCYFHIWYSQEARTYTLLALAATLFAGTSLWFLREATLPRLAAAFGSGVVLLYSHPYGTLTWLSVALAGVAVLLAHRRDDDGRTRIWILLQVAIAAAFAPWAWLLLLRARAIEQGGFWIPYPNVGYLITALVTWGSGFLALVLVLLGAAAAFLLPARGAQPEERAPDSHASPLRLSASRETWVIVGWLAGPIAMGLAISLIGRPIFLPYYVIGSLPALLLLAAIGLARFAVGVPSTIVVALYAVVASALGLAYGIPGQREDWRAVAAFVAANLPADGCVVVSGNLEQYAFQYYDRQPLCVLYGADVAATSATKLIALMVGNRASLAPVFSSPQWRAGAPVDFQAVTVVPLTRVGG